MSSAKRYHCYNHRNFLDCIAGFTSNIDGLAHLSTAMRAQYQSWISHDQPIMLQALSIEGTVAGAIQEVGVLFMGFCVMVSKTSGYQFC